MEGDVEALMRAGGEALRAGRWADAEERYRVAVDRAEVGEALFGLGIARWWSGDTDEALRCWERAYAAFRRRDDPGPAVLCAVYLCLAFHMNFGNEAAARGWLTRAAAVVEASELAALEGWVLLCRAHLANDRGQAQDAARSARQALALARAHGDADLALCAESELGAALVASGDTERGAALMDSAMAAALAGEGGDFDTVVLVSCRTVSTCSRMADIARAVQWIRAADDFHRRVGSTHLYTTCRTHYGSVLFAVGDWKQAEEELHLAMEGGRRAEPLLWAEAAAKLAELRLAQGRIGDAEQLVAGLEDQPVATYARAALSLVRAAPTATASSVRRRLGAADVQASERARLLDLLVQAHVAARDDPALADEVEALAATPNVDGGVVAAYQARAIGRGRAALGDGAAADDLEKALAGFGSVGMPYEAGRTRLLLATLLAGRDDQTAIADARGALACFDQLGATRDADAAAALLRSLGVRSPRAGRRVDALLSRREHDVLQLLSEGLANRDIADRLYISPKTVEHHVASILGKLGLRRRAEAAAYALRHLEDGPAARRE